MPLFEYRCADCDQVLELFIQPSDPEPRLCGYRCPLEREDERRGSGLLARVLSVPAPTVPAVMMGDRPTGRQLEKSGFTVYHNEGSGLVRGAGELGPARIREKE